MSKKIRGDSDLFISNPNYSAFLNSRGLYDPFSFILKLNFSVSVTMNNLREKQFDSKEELSQDELYDFSTYLHETIHWWQHIGSVTGIILSLSPIIQTHSNFSPVKTFLKSFKVKSVYNFLASFESDKMISEEEDIANLIINNFLDIEFFKLIVIKPYEINRIQSSPLFQSVGHSYGIMYEFFNTILDKTFPSSEDIFPDYQSWDSKFKEMEISKTPGYFHGSGHSYAPIGLFEIFEGKARFNQLFFLHFSTNGLLDWLDFENRGLLEDQYKKALK